MSSRASKWYTFFSFPTSSKKNGITWFSWQGPWQYSGQTFQGLVGWGPRSFQAHRVPEDQDSRWCFHKYSPETAVSLTPNCSWSCCFGNEGSSALGVPRFGEQRQRERETVTQPAIWSRVVAWVHRIALVRNREESASRWAAMDAALATATNAWLLYGMQWIELSLSWQPAQPPRPLFLISLFPASSPPPCPPHVKFRVFWHFQGQWFYWKDDGVVWMLDAERSPEGKSSQHKVSQCEAGHHGHGGGSGLPRWVTSLLKEGTKWINVCMLVCMCPSMYPQGKLTMLKDLRADTFSMK